MSNNVERKILLVDDSQGNLFSLRALIKEELGAEVFEADSGKLALEILQKEAVDLIVLDAEMPEMDGFETAKVIQSQKEIQNIPIVFLTAAYDVQEVRQKGSTVKAVDYIAKPIDADELISRLEASMRAGG